MTRRIAKLLMVAVVGAGLWLVWPESLHGQVAYVRVDGHSMDPTYHLGDLAVVRRQPSYRVGDPVAYKIPKGEFGAGAMVIHRLVGGDGASGYVTKGDNRTIVDPWHPRTQDILGRVRLDIPSAGTRLAQASQPVYLGGIVAALTVGVMLWPSGRADRPTGRSKRRSSYAGKHSLRRMA
jgi:signal peptidase